MKQSKKQLGFSLMEIIVVIGVFTTLFGVVMINMLGSVQKATLQSSITELLANLKQQQLQAMTLVAASGTTASYGIYFGTNTYTLFRGDTYQAGNSSNFTVSLGDNVILSSVLLPNTSVVFQRMNGEIASYNSSLDTITIKNTQTNEQKTLELNRYGIVTSVN